MVHYIIHPSSPRILDAPCHPMTDPHDRDALPPARCLSEASLPADIQRSLSGLQGLEPVGPGVEAATGLKGSCLGVQDRIDELEGLLEQSSVQVRRISGRASEAELLDNSLSALVGLGRLLLGCDIRTRVCID